MFVARPVSFRVSVRGLCHHPFIWDGCHPPLFYTLVNKLDGVFGLSHTKN